MLLVSKLNIWGEAWLSVLGIEVHQWNTKTYKNVANLSVRIPNRKVFVMPMEKLDFPLEWETGKRMTGQFERTSVESFPKEADSCPGKAYTSQPPKQKNSVKQRQIQEVSKCLQTCSPCHKTITGGTPSIALIESQRLLKLLTHFWKHCLKCFLFASDPIMQLPVLL